MSLQFLQYPKPFEYESLGNYIYRLAEENYCEVAWIWNELQYPPNTRLHTLNNEYKISILDIIAKATNNCFENIYNMTVHRFSFGSWTSTFGFKSSLSFSNTVSSYHSNYCPLCLQEKQYHRIYWSLTPLVICIIHNAYLETKCSSCGQSTYSDDVILGKCSCGHVLSKTESLYCEDKNIIQNQQRISEMFGVYKDTPHMNLHKCSSNNLTYDVYIEFIKHLKSIIKIYNIDISSLLEFNSILPKDFKEAKVQFYAEYLLKNWPNNFINFLNFFNKQRYLNKSIGTLTPIYIVLGLEEVIKKYDFLITTVWDYFLKKYNAQFFYSALKSVLVNKKYAPVDIAAKCFRINSRAIIKNFRTLTINDLEYVSIEDILNLILAFIKHGDIYKQERGYININHYKLKSLPSATIYEIYNLFLKGKFQVKINPFKVGFCMIYVNESELINVLHDERNC